MFLPFRRVKVRPHHVFELKNNDLISESVPVRLVALPRDGVLKMVVFDTRETAPNFWHMVFSVLPNSEYSLKGSLTLVAAEGSPIERFELTKLRLAEIPGDLERSDSVEPVQLLWSFSECDRRNLRT